MPQNTELLATWLKARRYESRFRPVPVEEFLVCDGAIHAVSEALEVLTPAVGQPVEAGVPLSRQRACRIVRSSEQKQLLDPVTNAVVALAAETARAGYGALVFCSSRRGCELEASLIGQVLADMSELDGDLRQSRLDLLGDLRNTPVGLDSTLEETIMRGVAFHRPSSCQWEPKAKKLISCQTRD